MPKPVLQAMVLADHVYQDRASGKFIIAGTFGTLFFGKSVTAPDTEGDKRRRVIKGRVSRVGSPFLYVALVEIQGETPLDLKFVDLSDASVKFEAKLIVNAKDPLAVAEFCVELPALPADKPGTFSLDLLYDNELLGSWRVAVKELPSEGASP